MDKLSHFAPNLPSICLTQQTLCHYYLYPRKALQKRVFQNASTVSPSHRRIFHLHNKGKALSINLSMRNSAIIVCSGFTDRLSHPLKGFPDIFVYGVIEIRVGVKTKTID